MQRPSGTFVILGLLFLLISTTGCGSQESALPTLIPRSEAGPVSEDASPGESPRDDQATGGIPPTWTPRPVQEASTPLPAADSPDPVTASEAEDRYVVQAGDTLAEIAAQFGVDLQELAQLNNIADVDRIEVGQVLVIPR